MYCRECGQKLTLRFCENEGLIPYCDKCESYMFPQFSVAVSMVVTNRAQDKILLAKHVEDDDFIASDTSSSFSLITPSSKKDVLMLGFIVIVEDGVIKLKEDEVSEARWCTPDEAMDLIRKGTTAEFFLNNAIRELKKKI